MKYAACFSSTSYLQQKCKDFRRSITLLLFLGLIALLPAQTIYYVNASSGNDGNSGTSWDFPFASFQKALDIVTANDQIWLAEGTYTPTHDANGQIPTDPRDATFFISQSNLQIFGGFPASGLPTMMDRNTDQYPTYLSGEIGTAGLTDNVYTVVHANIVGQTTLTGLFIEGGYADGSIGAIRRRGGGLYHETSGFSSRILLIECRFFGNTADYGGAIYHSAAGGFVETSLDRCELSANLADSYGGAIYFAGDNGTGFIDVKNSILTGNSAGLNGGAFAYDDGDITSTANFTHCTFYDNTVPSGGGGVAAIHFWDSNFSSPRFENCIFNSNSLPSIVWNGVSQGSFAVSYSVFDDPGCLTAVSNCQTNFFDTDPQLIDPANGNFNLNACSAIIDEGDPSIMEAFDFDGDSRGGAGVPDPGAQEYIGAPCCSGSGIVYVNASATGLNNGTSWTDAFTDLQAAIDFENAGSCSGTAIWVAAGTYTPSSDTSGNINPIDPRDKTFHTANFISLFGGFVGFETNLNQRNPTLNPTILSGELGNAGPNDNAYTVFYLEDGRNLLLNGFTVSDGRADGPVGGSRGEGGGIYVAGHSSFNGVAISDCVISRNYARRGGGIYLASSELYTNNGLTCSSTHFDQNTALLEGGAIYVDANNISSSSSVWGCRFTNNQTSNNYGGAIYYHGGFTTPGFGSGMVFHNCLFAGNSAPQGGSVLAYDDDDGAGIKFYHSTIYGNNSTTGAALEIVGWTDGQEPINLVNSLLWNNGSNFPATGTTYFHLDNCLIQESACPIVAQCSAVLLNEDPLLLDPANGDYHLADCSPAIDAGKDTLGVSALDFEGDNRPIGNWPDIGYDEYNGNGCCPPGNAYFVNATATGANTGQSWTDAFTSLQAALDAYAGDDCTGVTEIWVAQGTYYPSKDANGNSNPTDPRDKTFYINRNLQLIGGFPNTGNPGRQDASPANTTILSGDIGFMGDGSDNAYTVVHTADLSDAVFENFTIEDGNADGGTGPRLVGGGWYHESSVAITNTSGQTPRLINIHFRNNGAYRGGAFYNEPKSSGEANPSFENCRFTENAAIDRGGALYSFGDNGVADFLLYNPVFDSNTATNNGAAIAWDDPNSGGIRCVNGSFYNNQVFQNLGEAIHIAFWDSGRESLEFINCAFDDNKSADVSSTAFPDLRFVNCMLMESSCPPSTDCSGGGNLFGLDPLFIDPVNGDFHLQTCSPAVDAGISVTSNTGDFEGDQRQIGIATDIGADELASGSCCPGGNVVFVDIDATAGRNDGTSWANAFTDLHNALNLFRSGICPNINQIWLAEGVYRPSQDRNGQAAINPRDNTFFIDFPVTIYGGFDGTETQLGQQEPLAHVAILSGDIGLSGDLSDNVYTVLFLEGSNTKQFYGLFIQDGNADDVSGLPGSQVRSGGGVYNDGVAAGASLPLFGSCIFINNSAIDGGAFYTRGGAIGGSGAQIFNCEFSNNFASGNGGGYAGYFSSGFIQNSLFEANEAAQNGGAIHLEKPVGFATTSFSLDGCRLIENEAQAAGGVLMAAGGGTVEVRFFDCLFEGNFAADAGAAHFNGMSINGEFFNCTLIDQTGGMNTAQCISTTDGAELQLNSSIIWSPSVAGADLVLGPANLNHVLAYSLIEASTCPAQATCANMIFGQDPLFVNPSGNYRLTQNSPAVDAGDPNQGAGLFDLDGNSRVQGSAVDLGCYESAFTALPVEWLYFRLEEIPVSKQLKLHWATATEANADYFQVERSTDGRNFQTIGRVEASGTSGSPNYYEWTDEEPFSGSNFYRLRQVDFDGTFSYSELRLWVGERTSAGPTVYPNPAAERLIVRSAAELIQINDGWGRTVLTTPVSPGGTTIVDIAALPSGMYWVLLDGQGDRIRFIKN